MVHTKALTAAAAALLLALPVSADGIYMKSSPVVQVDAKNYDRLIASSNHTSIVEFYAPWCGHCQNLKPAYEKAAKSLQGLAKVAAVNCDEDSNKQFCGSMGVQGFPTLKIVKPGKKPGKPIVEDYQGPRTAKGIADAVVDKIPNHVTKVDDKGLETFLANANDSAKAILFTEKGTTSALLKALAIDFLGSVNVAQIRNTQKASVELFGITKFPTLLLLPGGPEAEGIVYDGEMKKDALVAFLSKVAEPNPDPAPARVTMPKKKESKKEKKAKEEFESASASHASEEGTAAAGSATAETLEDASNPTESPDPKVEKADPVVVVDLPDPIPALPTGEELTKACLSSKSSTCVLAFVPKLEDQGHTAEVALTSLAEIVHKHKVSHKMFPFYAIPEENDVQEKLRSSLELKDGVEVIAINARRGWWKRYENGDMHVENLERWIDDIRLGEGVKNKLPEGIVAVEKVEEHDEL